MSAFGQEAENPEVQRFEALFTGEGEEAGYRALEAWVFEPGLPSTTRRERLEIARLLLVHPSRYRSWDRQRQSWADLLLAKLEAECGDDWRALAFAGSLLNDLYLVHHGVVIDGGFRRGVRSDGQHFSERRDRVRSLQFFRKAAALAREQATDDELAALYLDFAQPPEGAFLIAPDELTDLDVLPDLDPTTAKPFHYFTLRNFHARGRNPLLGPGGSFRLPAVPASFDEARSDLERVRWLLAEAARLSKLHRPRARLEAARFWERWLGVACLSFSGYYYIEGLESEFDPNAPGEFELHTLKDHETFLLGDAGPERRALPEDARFIGMIESVLAEPAVTEEVAIRATEALCDVFANRRQLHRTEHYAKQLAQRFPESELAQKTAAGILSDFAPDGEFIKTETFRSGQKVTVGYVSRDIFELDLQLWQLDLDQAVLLSERNTSRHALDFTAGGYPESWVEQGSRSRWERERIDELLPCHKLIRRWTVPIRAKPFHLQGTTTIEIPDLAPGHYYLAARHPDGYRGVPVNLEHTILSGVGMDADTSNYLAIDARTGEPATDAEVVALENPNHISNPDHAGLLSRDEGRGNFVVRRPGLPPELKMPTTSQLDDWGPGDSDAKSIFFITNQPLYRPGQTVRYAGWMRPNRMPWNRRGSAFEEEAVRLTVTDPAGSTLHTATYELDEFGGFHGELPLAAEVVLGPCNVKIERREFGPAASDDDPFGDQLGPREERWIKHGQTWRFEVAEFRKPDFRVEVAANPDPDLDAISATVTARYQSGEPVRKAAVLAELRAYPVTDTLFPPGEFEWLYGDPGYWWPLPATKWMPGWDQWGVRYRPFTYWGSSGWSDENEVVLTARGETDENGVATIAFPEELPLLDRYPYSGTIRAGVQEFTGRSAAGRTGFYTSQRTHEVLAVPGKGFYEAGEEVTVTLHALSRSRDPIAANGVLTISRVSYAGPEREMILQSMLERAIEIGESGNATAVFTPPAPGQYRFHFRSGDAKSGFLLNVLGDGFEARELRFNPLQLTPEKCDCAPGETVRVAIHTDTPDTRVWLFQVMPNGERQTPRLLRTRGKVAVVEVPVTTAAVPEIVLHGVTVADGETHNALCRIVVPPRHEILDVDLAATPAAGEPGQNAEVTVQVRDHEGQPLPASFALTAYDRALADLGGSLPVAHQEFVEARETAEDLLDVAGRDEDPWTRAFHDLYTPGCFSERGNLTGDPRWQPTSRFERIGENLWVEYEPPELPNQVGMTPQQGLAAIFPLTPATPAAGALRRAENVSLGQELERALRETVARSRFADHAYWGAAIRTGADGRASVSFELPDNLTTWKLHAWAFGKGRQYGDGEAEVTVSKPLQVRPIIPRAAVAGDELVLSALVQNSSGVEQTVHVQLDIAGVETSLAGGAGDTQSVTIPPGQDGHANWKVLLDSPGTAALRFVARTADGALSDGARVPFVIAPRVAPQTVAARARLDNGQAEQRLALNLPAQARRAEIEIRLTANPARDAFAALPDLVQYPYGCTEQTLNKFLPLLVAWQTVDKLGLDWGAMQKQIRDHPRSLAWVRGHLAQTTQTVSADLTREKVQDMARVGLGRLEAMQNGNGSWGWFGGDGRHGSPYLTALAARGIALARESGLLDADDRPANWSTRWLSSHADRRAGELDKKTAAPEPEDPFVLLAFATGPGAGHDRLQAALLARSDELKLTGKILLALSLNPGVAKDRAAINALLPAIEMGIAALDEERPKIRHWWNDPIETRAWHLKLVARLDPNDPRLAPLAEELLALRRDGIRWQSTRDTALCIEALAAALPGLSLPGPFAAQDVRLDLPGETRSVTLNADNDWSAAVTIPLAEAPRICELRVHRAGDLDSPLRVSAIARCEIDGAREDPVPSSGLQVTRSYFRLAEDGTRTALGRDDVLHPGELVEVELRLASDQAREFVHLRDPVPAGLEPLHQQSGSFQGAYRESRLGETNFFISHLWRWNDTYRYPLRVVTPGRSLALPARAECMYAPDLFGTTKPAEFQVEPAE